MNKEFALRYLTAIEKKNQRYFLDNKLQIIDCVKIIEGKMISVHIINQSLPFEIKYEIESMFWH